MQFKFILGVDISKEWFNFCLMNSKFDIIWEGLIHNATDSILLFISQLTQHDKVNSLNDIILILEFTGIYVLHLVRAWNSKNARLTIVPAPKVSQLLNGKGSWEEKTDQIDARRLAEYAIRYTDKIIFWKEKSFNLTLLQAFQRQHSRIIDVINILEVPANEFKLFHSAEISQQIIDVQQNSINVLKNDLIQLENKINQLIQQDLIFQHLFKLITSVPGIGPVIAREIIITTAAFNDFLPNQAKAFAKYAGVIPLKKESGKFKKRSTIKKAANRKIKSLLTMGATSLIKSNNDLGRYYKRKVEEGKPHFLVINAMRNKLILRIFAVVRNQTIYQKNIN